jgi:hypothetical protein
MQALPAQALVVLAAREIHLLVLGRLQQAL